MNAHAPVPARSAQFRPPSIRFPPSLAKASAAPRASIVLARASALFYNITYNPPRVSAHPPAVAASPAKPAKECILALPRLSGMFIFELSDYL